MQDFMNKGSKYVRNVCLNLDIGMCLKRSISGGKQQ